MATTLESPLRPASGLPQGPGLSGTVLSVQLTQASPTLYPDILPHPARVQSPSVPTITPSLAPLLSAHSLSICIPSPPPLRPPHPRPPSLGDKRARLERVPRSFIPHHMGPKAKSSAKRLNQVCRTKCYELTLWVYNFMPFVAICLSKQPPFHTDIQTHTFPPTPTPLGRIPPPPTRAKGQGQEDVCLEVGELGPPGFLGIRRNREARNPRGLRDGRVGISLTCWPGRDKALG